MSKLKPWQAELFVKLEEGYKKGSEMTIMMGRQSGKSVFHQLYKEFMNKPAKRFILGRGPIDKSILLFIEDYVWWTVNEREILNWMATNLPRGIEHQQGMVLTFDSEQDRVMFLLRWA